MNILKKYKKAVLSSPVTMHLRSELIKHPGLHRLAKKTIFGGLRFYHLVRTGRLPSESSVSFNLRSGSLRVAKDQGLVAAGDIPGAPAERVESFLSHYEPEQDFSALHTDVRALAYYLPQFHAIPENDKWWGDGFTEWTNTRKTGPLFPGHYQPREPHDDIGYYDLSDPETMRRQVAMAKRHGIHGFVFYHYWFHGQRLLGKPADMLLARPEIDMPFCFCWANETWSRRWDGKDHEILVQQTYSEADDIKFIEFLAPYFRDPRYVRVDGKPVLLVYRVLKLPSAAETVQRWRRWCREHGIGEIHLVAVSHSEVATNKATLRKTGFDAYAAFTPHNFPCEQIAAEEGIFDGGHRFDYASGVEAYMEAPSQPDVYECCTLGWDNTPRFGKRANIYLRFSLGAYYQWLAEAIRRTREKFKDSQRLVFINAWNEWAEGAYLEPDRKYGYASLNTTSKAIFGLPLESAEKYTQDYDWLKFTIENNVETSLSKINKFLKDSCEILEFGPAAGYFTRYLKEERHATVDIIEIDEECAKRAAEFARRCFVGDLERDDWRAFLQGRSYDFILFADVLEHLRDPLGVLRQAAPFLKPGGSVLISVPNIAHWQILASLINNDFSYGKVGIMDKTHLRFFTIDTLQQMVTDAGLRPDEVKGVMFPHLPLGCGTKWNRISLPRKMKKFLRSRPFADAVQIVVRCSSAAGGTGV